MWSDDWVGIPYEDQGRAREGFDCYGLFIALQAARRGLTLPDHRWSKIRAFRGGVEASEPDWKRVETAIEGDAALFLTRGHPVHVGYCLDNRMMLHTEAKATMSMVENFRCTRWAARLHGIFRYVGSTSEF